MPKLSDTDSKTLNSYCCHQQNMEVWIIFFSQICSCYSKVCVKIFATISIANLVPKMYDM